MNISEDDIKLIIRLISEKLGPNASPEKVRSLAAEAIGQLSIVSEEKPVTAENITDSTETIKETKIPRKLIVNAFGLTQSSFEDSLRTYLIGKSLPIIAFSSNNIEQYRSVIAIIDNSDYKSDINSLKFELSQLCGRFGFKAIIQDSAYYGLA